MYEKKQRSTAPLELGPLEKERRLLNGHKYYKT